MGVSRGNTVTFERVALAIAGILIALVAVMAVMLPSSSFAEPDERVPNAGEGADIELAENAIEASTEGELGDLTGDWLSEDELGEPESPDAERLQDGFAVQTQAGERVVEVSTYEEFASAVNNAPAGETTIIDVTADFAKAGGTPAFVPASATVEVRSTSGKAITLNASQLISGTGESSVFILGEGLVVDCNNTESTVAYAEFGASVILDGATVQNANYSGLRAMGAIGAGSKLLIKSGTVQNCSGSVALFVSGGANGEISGGAIRNCAMGSAYAPIMVTSAGSDVPSSLTISGGTISGNAGMWGGAIYCQNAQLVMTGGTISNNSASLYGGGVYLTGATGSFSMTGGNISSNTATHYGGGVIAGAGATFTLDGGTISDNKADSGGGLYVFATTEVYLKSGRIDNNRAVRGYYGTGGGITVASNSATSIQGFHMADALITGNSAGTIGGGAWLCPTGEVDSEISDGVAVYDNTAGHAADDLAVVITGGNTHGSDVIQSRMLGGGIAERYYDGTLVDYGTDVQDHGDGGGARYRADGRRDRFDYATWHGDASIAIHNEASENSRTLAEQRARLFITGNTATNAGGGIASNGNVWVGKAESKSVVVKKVWGLPDGASALSEVRVKLDIDGARDGVAREVEEVVLNADNNWTHTFEGLPVKAKVNLEEAAVSAPGWVSYYKESFSDERAISNPDTDEGGTEQTVYYALEDVGVTNAREGKLTISKAVDGNRADPDREFQFQVAILNPEDALETPIVDEQSGEETLYAPYEGRNAEHHVSPLDFEYSGSTSGTLQGGSGTITLKAGESVTVSGLPHGAWYRVREVASAADGYEIIPRRGDGAVGHAAETGTITGDATATLAYTNVKGDRMGSLMVSKKVDGNAADPAQLFHFQVRFYHEDGSELTEGEFAYMNSHEGVIGSGGTFALKDGESIHIDGIPTGTRWVVKEVPGDAHGYEIEPVQGALKGEDAEEGVIETGKTAALSYTNVKESTMGALAVSKQVASGEKDRDFEFVVSFADASGADIEYGEFAYTGDREGLVESGDMLKLSHGQRIVIEGLPAGTRYQVREVNADGYTAMYDNSEGAIAASATAEVKVVNEKSAAPAANDASRTRTPRTGDSMTVVLSLTAAISVLAALSAVLARVIYRRERL